MSDDEKEIEKPFAVERAKTGRAKCKKCKCPIDKDTVRIAKLMSNPFGDGKMKAWHHVTCLFEVFAKQRATTKRIDDPEEDISGWDDLRDEDKKIILEKLEEFEQASPFKAAKGKQSEASPSSPKKRKRPSKGTPEACAIAEPKKPKAQQSPAFNSVSSKPSSANIEETPSKKKNAKKDDAFREFRRLCTDVANVDAYTEKTAIVKKMLTNGTSGDGFKGDVKLWCKLLLPGAVQRVYNLQSKQLVKLFGRILLQDEDEMLEHLELGDVAETIREFFEKSSAVSPASKSLLSIQEVDQFLERLSFLTREEEQIQHFRSIINRCTGNDLKMIVRLIKHDLRINAGPKHILNAIHDDAYRAFQMSRDLDSVIERCLGSTSGSSSPEKSSNLLSTSPGGNKVTLSLMTPVLPMLAEACKSVEMAMKKCPNGMLSEVKYDGERVQVHKRGGDFRYFSRSLKPVMPHKVNHFKEFIPKAFPDGNDLILDSEVLMIDTKTGQPLPFGSLGIHKKAEFKDANVCLFVFDCIYYNGEALLNKTMQERRQILKDNMTEIPNRIMLSEVQEVHDPRDLAQMIAKVLKMGLEGLVLKDVNGKYEPGKRHWLKVKRDYLFDGAMADTADLVVLGAWYGTGNKGGMMSVFLMGCYDEDRDVWLTVTKVHTGHDDATLASLQDELKMVKIAKDPNKLPTWLRANKPMIPDFVAQNPKDQPVWEITGAEFTNQGVHTADGISIRFPRVTRIRHDKDWKTATSLKELRVLFDKKSESIDFSLLASDMEGDSKATSAKKLGPLDSFVKKEPVEEEEPPTSASTKRKNESKVDGSVINVKKKRDLDIPSTSNNHSSGKTKYDADMKIKEEPSENGVKNSIDKKKDENRAEYYAFVENDRSKSILKDVRASLSRSIDGKRWKRLRRTLKTLGAEILEDEDRGKSTHVIHDCAEIPSGCLQEYEDVPRSARHVNASWLEASASTAKMQDTEKHAVALAADYCTCACTHR